MTKSGHKIVFAGTSGEITDPKTWSGTPKRIFDHLSPYFASSETLNYELTSFPKFTAKVCARLFNWWNSSRNKYFNSLYEKQFRRGWSALKSTPDVCFHIGDFCVPAGLGGKARHFVYTDATLMGTSRFHPRAVSESFLDGYRRLSRKYLDSVETVFTLNEWARRSFIEDHRMKPEQVVNAGFGINIEPFAGEKDWNQNLLLIVLRPKVELIKGLTLLLEAFPLVRREIPDAQLAVVGTQVAGAPEGVTSYFNQPRTKTIELMRSAVLYTMPALCEVNGIVYPEALASRTPILGLNRYSVPEFAGDGRYGFIVKEANARAVADAIIGALKDKATLQRMGEEGQRFVVGRYSWKRTAEQMFQTIERSSATG